MPLSVVYEFETIDIQEDERELGLGRPPYLLDFTRQGGQTCPAVQHPGQIIERELVPKSTENLDRDPGQVPIVDLKLRSQMPSDLLERVLTRFVSRCHAGPPFGIRSDVRGNWLRIPRWRALLLLRMLQPAQVEGADRDGLGLWWGVSLNAVAAV
jgi:hypothetical protein